MFLRLLILFITVPLVELALFLKLGEYLGIPATLFIILTTGILGAWLTKRQGLRTFARFQQASAQGRIPQDEIIDGLLILVAGAVLLTPGFLTDALGFFLLLPSGRTIVRKRLLHTLAQRVHLQPKNRSSSPPPGDTSPSSRSSPRSPASKRSSETIIDAEIIDEDHPS